ncbi:MAG: hypothetical protein ACRCWF_16810 [Beijerinckiaceae bacterium]
MVRDFLLSIFSFLVIEPFQAEFNEKLRSVQAPAAVIEQVQACARSAAPVLADKALQDWWWAGTTTVYVAIGMQTPESVMVELVPACAPAINAAKPFLNSLRS